MKTLHFTLAAALLQVAAVLAKAQTSIGIPGPGDADVALHVRASATNTAGPIRLEGLKIGSIETNVLVTDANGVLRFRSAASLMTASANTELWLNNSNVISPVSNRAVSIGQTNAASATDQLTVNGNAILVGASQLRFRDGTNYIYSEANNNNWYFKGQSYVSFRDRANATDLFTVQANSGRVGIKTRDPSVDFEVGGTQRMTGSNPIEFSSSVNRIFRNTDNDFRFVAQTETNFMNRSNTTKLLTVNANTERVGIKEPSPSVDFEVNGTQRITASNALEFSSNANRIFRNTNDDLRFIGRTEVNFMDRNNVTKIMTVDANEGRVGIGTNTPQTLLEVNGTGRMTGSNQLEFASSANRIYRNTNDDWRFVGRTEVNFMDRNNAIKIMTVDGREARVGIGTTTPQTLLEVNGTGRMTGSSQLEFGSGINRIYRNANDDWRFVGRSEVNFMDRNDAIKIMTVNALDRRVGIGTATPARDFHVQGTMRLTGDVGVPNLSSDFVLLADANGDLRRATIASVRGSGVADNLGNHIATRNVQLSTFYLSGDGGDEGVTVNAAGQVGIGTLAPSRTLHVRENGNNTAELLIENATINSNAVLRFAEGNVTQNFGYNFSYDGVSNQLNLGNNTGDVHLNIGRNSGNVAIGNAAVQPLDVNDKLLVNGDRRVSRATTGYCSATPTTSTSIGLPILPGTTSIS